MNLLRYLQKQSWHWYVALAIMLIGGFLRLYRVPDTLMFLGDQGRDALIVARIFKEFDPVLIGPVTSVGNLYLGPLYYYFMLPFLWLSYPSPLGPVYAVAIFSTLNLFLLYHVGKKMFSPLTGLIAATIMAFSASAIELSRFSWNPNLAPLLSTLMIYFIWQTRKNYRYWLLVSSVFSAIIQLHYLTLLTGVSAFLLWLFSSFKLHQKPIIVKEKLKTTLLAGLIFILSLTPQLVFDLRHNAANISALGKMFTQEEIFVDHQARSIPLRLKSFLNDSVDRAGQILVTLNVPLKSSFIKIGAVMMLIGLFFLMKKKSHQEQTWFNGVTIVFIFLIVGILGTGLYQHPVYTHYIAYLIPISSLAIALLLRMIIKYGKKIGSIVVIAIIAGFIVINQSNWPLKPNFLYHKTQTTAQIIQEALRPSDRYELVLLSETKDLYAQSYRYFLSTTNNPPIVAEKGETPNTLIIIDEEKKEKDVLNLPIYEIQIFPNRVLRHHIKNQDLPDIYIID